MAVTRQVMTASSAISPAALSERWADGLMPNWPGLAWWVPALLQPAQEEHQSRAKDHSHPKDGRILDTHEGDDEAAD